jgi:hypothetical protein
MSKRFRSCHLNPPYLPPPDLQDWLPATHLARINILRTSLSRVPGKRSAFGFSVPTDGLTIGR